MLAKDSWKLYFRLRHCGTTFLVIPYRVEFENYQNLMSIVSWK